MDAIDRVEVPLRTGWAHKRAVRYGAHAHEDKSRFRDVDKHNKCLNNLTTELGRSHEAFVSHYRERYSRSQAAAELGKLRSIIIWPTFRLL